MAKEQPIMTALPVFYNVLLGIVITGSLIFLNIMAYLTYKALLHHSRIAAHGATTPTDLATLAHLNKRFSVLEHLPVKVTNIGQGQDTLSEQICSITCEIQGMKTYLQHSDKSIAQELQDLILASINRQFDIPAARPKSPLLPPSSYYSAATQTRKQDTSRQVMSTMSGLTTQATTPQDPPTLASFFSPVVLQATATGKPAPPVLSLSAISCQSTAPLQQPSVRLGISSVARQETVPSKTASPVLSVSIIAGQSTSTASPKVAALESFCVQSNKTAPADMPRQEFVVDENNVKANSIEEVQDTEHKDSNDSKKEEEPSNEDGDSTQDKNSELDDLAEAINAELAAQEEQDRVAKEVPRRKSGLGSSIFCDPKASLPSSSAKDPTDSSPTTTSYLGPSSLVELMAQPKQPAHPETMDAFCKICDKTVEIDVAFDVNYQGPKDIDYKPSWDRHDRDFHGDCPACHESVSGIYDSTRNMFNFDEHNKVCPKRKQPKNDPSSSSVANPPRSAPATSASSKTMRTVTCRYCHTKVTVPTRPTDKGEIPDFTTHNITCEGQKKMTRVHFHCTNCGLGVTNKSEFFKVHLDPCKEQARADGNLGKFDAVTGRRVDGPAATSAPIPTSGQQAPPSSTPAKTKSPGGLKGFSKHAVPTAGQQDVPSAPAASSPTVAIKSSGGLKGLSKYAAPTSNDSGANEASAKKSDGAPSWQGNVIPY
jgi:hypothetical protein